MCAPLSQLSSTPTLLIQTRQNWYHRLERQPQKSDGSDIVVLKAMGRAINKAVTIAEILKRKAPLHQVTTLSSCEMIDVFEPLEEGLDTVTSRRYVSCLKITLSKQISGIDVNDIGYQPPLTENEIKPGDLNPNTPVPPTAEQPRSDLAN